MHPASQSVSPATERGPRAVLLPPAAHSVRTPFSALTLCFFRSPRRRRFSIFEVIALSLSSCIVIAEFYFCSSSVSAGLSLPHLPLGQARLLLPARNKALDRERIRTQIGRDGHAKAALGHDECTPDVGERGVWTASPLTDGTSFVTTLSRPSPRLRLIPLILLTRRLDGDLQTHDRPHKQTTKTARPSEAMTGGPAAGAGGGGKGPGGRGGAGGGKGKGKVTVVAVSESRIRLLGKKGKERQPPKGHEERAIQPPSTFH